MSSSVKNPKAKESLYKCPKCGASCEVIRTKGGATEIIRERQCNNGHKFGTKEEATDFDYLVRRRNGVEEPFNRKFALEHSIMLAGADDLTEREAAAVAYNVMRRLDLEKHVAVDTEAIGKAVIDELRTTHGIAALRYATTFQSSRNDSLTAEEFLKWAEEKFHIHRSHLRVEERPQWVIKKPKINRNPGFGEDFTLAKLWIGFSTATRRLKVAVPNSPTLTNGELSGALSAYVLSTVKGQAIVTSSQLSSAALLILRSVCPLGYLRFAAKAKGHRSENAFLDEVRSLIEYESPLIDLTPFLATGKAIAEEVHPDGV